MTDKEIIQQLETCTYYPNCPECPYYEKSDIAHECMVGVMRKAYDLIKRQQAEIDRLTVEKDKYKYHMALAQGLLLTNNKAVRTKAIKEFAEKLKNCFAQQHLYGSDVIFNRIDLLVKEMVGADNG